MDVKAAVELVASKFRYKRDTLKFFDSWRVLRPNSEGELVGDCDDFSLTAIWNICDRNIWKFILNVVILHRYRFWYSRTLDGQPHVIGYAKGLFFDNYSMKALPKKEFFETTGHKRWFVYPSFYILLYMLIGAFTRKA